MFHNQMTYNGTPPFFPANLLLLQQQQQQQPPHISVASHDSGGEKHYLASNPQGLTLGLLLPNDYSMDAGVQTVLGKRSLIPSSGGLDCEELNMEEGLSDEDGAAPATERKNKLSLEQVGTLERHFEMGSKLEPDRKMELARALGLRPRQIAIWFQNRRARWKTKQMERDYEELRRKFDAMKTENDALQAQNKKLLCELLALKGKEISEPINLNKETEGSCSIRSENSSDAILDISRAPPVQQRPSDPHHGRIFFPSFRPPPSVTQFDMISAKSETTAKVENNNIQEENFCNLFCISDDQSAFWAWQEHHNFQH
ncbi:hypothetical protein Cni_G05558 [Canna indica]|uniref:Homeobox-leucine zipper protein n=1 Tax=Canna indica TaxID=4628 RepID=A0AAQ3Q542_9LILI|nr:hypothetical protein Cni_G05558 [Canna indica]